MKEIENIENLIARYLNGNSSREEQQQIVEWIEEIPDHKNRFLSLKDIWDVSGNNDSHTGEQLVLFYKNRLEKARRSRILWIRSSSAVAAVLFIGLIISNLIPQKVILPPENFQVFSVPLGSKSKVLLADGTEVNLNSGSELKFSNNYSESNRVVSLKGEGYFNVKSDVTHPFVVKTSDFEVKVTGTKFNVCSYEDNEYSSATLDEGKISLQMNRSSQVFVIHPGEKFDLNRSSKAYSIAESDVESEIAWINGEFKFNGIPFPDLVQRLERWYDVKLNYSGAELHQYKFTGRFKNQETIWQVLDALKLVSPIDYRKTSFREFVINYKPHKMN